MSENNTIDIQKIMKILPHRYPFLLVDRVIEYEPKKRAVAIKNVTLNEPQFTGHFPNFPIMPGVLIVEAMVQTGAILLLQEPEASGKLVFFAGIENVRFKRPVVPGDQMRMEVESVWVKRGMGRIKGVTTVDGNVVAEGEFTFSLAPASLTGSDVHPSANVHPKAEIGKNVIVGPYVTIAADVVIGEGTEIGANSVIKDGVRIGAKNKIGEGVVLGAPPQDTKYEGEKSFVKIGDNNQIREYVTIHSATGDGGSTVIGNNNFLMAYVHIGHNCVVGSDVTITIQAAIGGHCVLEDQSVIGGLSALHQYIRVGKLAMIGGVSRVIQDIPPYMMAVGNPSLIRGVNTVGISRRGGGSAALTEIKNAYKVLYRSGLNFSQAIEKLQKELKSDEGKHLLAFLAAPSKRGVLKKAGTEEEES